MSMTFNSFAAFAEHLEAVVLIETATEEAALEVAAELIEKTAKERIGTEYHAWLPLAESTLREKARLGYAVPAPLLRTGEMRGSIGHIVRSGYAEVGSNDDIALWQELGTSRIPPRSFLGSSAQDVADVVVGIIGKAVSGVLGGKRIEDIVMPMAAD